MATDRKPRDRKPRKYPDEVRHWVCTSFSNNQAIPEIKKGAEEKFKIVLSGGAVYDLLRQGAEKGHFVYVSPRHNKLTTELTTLDQKFTGVGPTGHSIAYWVTFTESIEDVARQGASVVCELLKELAVTFKDRPNRWISVGFSGGFTMKLLAQRLSSLLGEPGYPKISFHSLVAGFDTTAAGTDPNSFALYLADNPEIAADRKKFLLFHAHPIVPSDRVNVVRNLPTIQEALDAAENLDLIITSAADIDDKHCQLRNYYESFGDVAGRGNMGELLRREHCVGDILWQPVAETGAIPTDEHPLQAMTIAKLTEFPGRIGTGTQVVMVVGPCAAPSGCGRTRTRPLFAAVRNRLVTHVVVDPRTAGELATRMQQESK